MSSLSSMMRSLETGVLEEEEDDDILILFVSVL
jgi:hypothetical protein